MKVGLFPGQGIPAKTVLEALAPGHRVLERASETLGYDLRRRVEIAGRRNGAMLPTALAQPAIFVAGLMRWSNTAGGDDFDFLAGHSIGEYTALVAAGALTEEQGLGIVRVRADAMETASKRGIGGMAAVIGLDVDTAARIAREAGITVANDNAPGQVVLAGPEEGLTEAASLVRGAGGRSVLLETAGPFHTPAMAPAEKDLEVALAGAPISMPEIPVVSNVSARPYSSADEIRNSLVDQLTAPVRFRESLEWVWGQGVRDFVDMGPGTVVKGLAGRTFRELEKAEVSA